MTEHKSEQKRDKIKHYITNRERWIVFSCSFVLGILFSYMLFDILGVCFPIIK